MNPYAFSECVFLLLHVQMSVQIQQQRFENEQLRREACMKRIPVSQAVEDIKVR